MNTAPTHIAGELTEMFDASRHGNGLSLEEIRHNYSVSAKMSDSDDTSIGGININPSGRTGELLGIDKDKKAAREFLLMTMLNDLGAMEVNLVDKYGEDFAENLAAEHLDEDTYMRLMAIEDQDERRRRIALELKQGIENGTVDADVLFENGDIKEWVEARSALEAHVVADARIAAETKLDVTDENGVDNAYAMNASNSEAAAFDKLLF